MADYVQFVVDKLALPLRELRDRGVFTAEEVRAVAAKRTGFEYVLRRRELEPADFQRYLRYEEKLEALRKMRMGRLIEHARREESRAVRAWTEAKARGGDSGNEDNDGDGDDDDDADDKAGDRKEREAAAMQERKRMRTRRQQLTRVQPCDKSGVKHMCHIYERAVRRFKDNLSLWTQYLDFVEKEDMRTALSQVLARAIKLHPREVGFWIRAADLEYRKNGNPGAARALLQRALRVNRRSVILWTHYFSMELAYTLKVREQRRLMDLLSQDSAERDFRSGEEQEALDEILGGQIATRIFDHAMRKLPTIQLKLDACQQFLAACLQYPQDHVAGVVDYIVGSLRQGMIDDADESDSGSNGGADGTTPLVRYNRMLCDWQLQRAREAVHAAAAAADKSGPHKRKRGRGRRNWEGDGEDEQCDADNDSLGGEHAGERRTAAAAMEAWEDHMDQALQHAQTLTELAKQARGTEERQRTRQRPRSQGAEQGGDDVEEEEEDAEQEQDGDVFGSPGPMLAAIDAAVACRAAVAGDIPSQSVEGQVLDAQTLHDLVLRTEYGVRDLVRDVVRRCTLASVSSSAAKLDSRLAMSCADAATLCFAHRPEEVLSALQALRDCVRDDECECRLRALEFACTRQVAEQQQDAPDDVRTATEEVEEEAATDDVVQDARTIEKYSETQRAVEQAALCLFSSLCQQLHRQRLDEADAPGTLASSSVIEISTDLFSYLTLSHTARACRKLWWSRWRKTAAVAVPGSTAVTSAEAETKSGSAAKAQLLLRTVLLATNSSQVQRRLASAYLDWLRVVGSASTGVRSAVDWLIRRMPLVAGVDPLDFLLLTLRAELARTAPRLDMCQSIVTFLSQQEQRLAQSPAARRPEDVAALSVLSAEVEERVSGVRRIAIAGRL